MTSTSPGRRRPSAWRATTTRDHAGTPVTSTCSPTTRRRPRGHRPPEPRTAPSTATRQVQLHAEGGFAGTDGFTYTVKDATNASAGAAVHVTVAAEGAGFSVKTTGHARVRPRRGGQASWSVSAASPPAAAADDGARRARAARRHRRARPARTRSTPASVRTATGWTADAAAGRRQCARGPARTPCSARPSETFPRPLPPISQGTGGDGHVPILVGSKVFAFFHHSHPTPVTCIDRVTGRCARATRALHGGDDDITGPAAVVGSRIYVHLCPSTRLRADRVVRPVLLGRREGPHLRARPSSTACRRPATRPLGAGARRTARSTSRRHRAALLRRPGDVEPCATASLPTGLAPRRAATTTSSPTARACSSPSAPARVACVDVAAGRRCAGWAIRALRRSWNLVNHHDASGARRHLRRRDRRRALRRATTTPSKATTSRLAVLHDYYEVTQEAETGTRTLIGVYPAAAASAAGTGRRWRRCTGGGYDGDGWLTPTSTAASRRLRRRLGRLVRRRARRSGPGVHGRPVRGSRPAQPRLQGTEPARRPARPALRRDVGAATLDAGRCSTTPAPGELASVDGHRPRRGDGRGARDEGPARRRARPRGIDPAAHPASRSTRRRRARPATRRGTTASRRASGSRGTPTRSSSASRRRTAAECEQPLAPIGLTAGLDGQAGKLEEQCRCCAPRARPCSPPSPTAPSTRRPPLALALAGSDPNGGALSYSLLEGPPGADARPRDGSARLDAERGAGPGAATPSPCGSAIPAACTASAVPVTVAEVNRPPASTPLADVALAAGAPLELRASASDPDLPANALSFSLADAPAGTSVDAATGAIRWPSPPPGAYRLTVRVTDNGAPALSCRALVRGHGGRAGHVRGEQSAAATSCWRAATAASCSRTSSRAARRVSLLGVADRSFAGRTSSCSSPPPARSSRARASAATGASPRPRRCRRSGCAPPTRRATRRGSARCAPRASSSRAGWS